MFSFFPVDLKLFMLITGLTLISGMCDSFGFVHAASVWQDGKLVWKELIKSGLGFAVGTTIYWIVIRYLNGAGLVAPELQTLFWFSATMIGIALMSGRFLHWHLEDQAVAVGVLCGIAWLMSRQGG